MSQPSEQFLDVTVQAQSPPDVEQNDDVTLEDIITAFLDVNPTPSDDQIHTLAALLNVPFEDFEAVIYKMFSRYVKDPESYAVDDAINGLTQRDGPEDDPVENLLVCFFSYHPDPTDVEIHQLSGLIDMTPEELEEILYAMLSEINDDQEAEIASDEIATEPCEQDEFPYQNDQLHTP
jgi:hypothetical protein